MLLALMLLLINTAQSQVTEWDKLNGHVFNTPLISIYVQTVERDFALENIDCDEDGEDCVTHDAFEATCVWYTNIGYSCSCDALTEDQMEDQILCDDDYTGDEDYQQYLFTKNNMLR